MSHQLLKMTKSNHNFRFNFMNKIFKQKLPEIEADNFYDDFIKLFNIIEFNIRGLNENIYYLLLLIKKNKINISLDIFEANILPILIHNYNFQFINEFCLLKQIMDNPDKIYHDINEYYRDGINFMIEKYQIINYSHEFYEVKKYNDESIIKLDGDDFDYIYYPNEQLIKNELANNSEICFNNETFYTYKIDKICLKIIKTTNDCGHKKQFKKNDIKNITIKKYRCKKLPSAPYINYDFRQYLWFSNREINDDLFEKFTKNKKNIINVYRLLKYVSAEVRGFPQAYRVRHFHTEIKHLYKLDELDDVNS